MSENRNPPSIKPDFTRAASGTSTPPVIPPSRDQVLPAPVVTRSFDMPGPDGHAVRHHNHQQLLLKALEHTQARHERLIEIRQKAGLPIKPQSLEYLEARKGIIDDIKQKFLEKAGITPAPENKSGSPQREADKIKEKFNDLSM